MTDPEIYWKVVSELNFLCITAATSYCFYYFVEPFLKRKRDARWIGCSYFLSMFVLYYMPPAVSNFVAYVSGVLVAFVVMCALDFRNIRQKIFLAVTFFLLRWISAGLAASIYSVLVLVSELPPIAAADLRWQFLVYVGMVICNIGFRFLFIWIAVRLILRAYVYKREDMSWRELILHLSPSLSIVTGSYGFQFCEKMYETDTGRTLWGTNGRYEVIINLYQAVSFGAILVTILVFQNIRSRQREEKQKELLSGQVEEMKRHIREVERLYVDIRSLRHDMGNHVMTLENLCQQREQQEAVQYVARLRQQLYETDLEVKTGNPVTDVILTEKSKEAEERGIAFICRFVYPEGQQIDAFDVSVILNNALSNALEAAVDCDSSRYILVQSYRENNAYMIEVKNSFCGVLEIDRESGLPVSCKEGTGHGFGMANIRRVAQKYYGEIEIEQEGDCFSLIIMLLLDGEEKDEII